MFDFDYFEEDSDVRYRLFRVRGVVFILGDDGFGEVDSYVCLVDFINVVLNVFI